MAAILDTSDSDTKDQAIQQQSGTSGSGDKGDKGDSKASSGLKAAGKKMQEYGQAELARSADMIRPNASPNPGQVAVPGINLPSLKKGGKIRKTGTYRLHAGERVLNAKQTKRFERGRSGKMSRGR